MAEDGRLDPSPEAESGQNRAHMRLHRGLARLEPRRDFGIGQALGQQSERVLLSGRQHGEDGDPPRILGCGARMSLDRREG